MSPKQRTTAIVFLTLVFVMCAVGVYSSIAHPALPAEITQPQAVVTAPQEARPAPPAEEVVPEVPEDKAYLAKDVELELLEQLGRPKSFTALLTDPDWPSDSLMGYIVGFEDISDGTVRVIVQADIYKSEAQQLGRAILGLVGENIRGLGTVVVQGVDGLDINVFRSSIPYLN